MDMDRFQRFSVNELKIIVAAMDAIHFTDAAASRVHKSLRNKFAGALRDHGFEVPE